MRIVVLDGRTTNPGDISREPLAALGELTVYDTTPPELAAARAREADVVIYCRMNITAELIDALPRLRYLGTLSTGYNTGDPGMQCAPILRRYRGPVHLFSAAGPV